MQYNLRVGDYVQYSGDWTPEYKGKTGYITRVEYERCNIVVEWNDTIYRGGGVLPSSLKIITEDISTEQFNNGLSKMKELVK